MQRLVDQETQLIKPHQEETQRINLGLGEDKKEILIGIRIEGEVRDQLINLLREHIDIFVWSYHDMPGLNPEIVEHKLPIKSEIHPVKKKLRRVKPEWSLKIKKKKKRFKSFCYKVMPFGLKNVRATYQRAKVTLFHDMIHKEIKVYIDDMIAKSKNENDHLVHLRKLFNRLCKYQLKLNHAKCTFGVQSGKLLGFIVSEKGIEVDPDKAKAIIEMSPPKTKKEVRGFLGKSELHSSFHIPIVQYVYSHLQTSPKESIDGVG
uniref:Retrovirus-related Pol polyprotein from transposon 297 family n=1 Tax=Cajanus cajan TaxID=3821 RepID=A0A151T324_CAJCA|nr:Retrovirus-related Pol polyprotein from transposon 297 family [Cajanus cajan]